jgi:hypothetical protein
VVAAFVVAAFARPLATPRLDTFGEGAASALEESTDPALPLALVSAAFVAGLVEDVTSAGALLAGLAAGFEPRAAGRRSSTGLAVAFGATATARAILAGVVGAFRATVVARMALPG